jgi:class 3 adenylate cyclase
MTARPPSKPRAEKLVDRVPTLIAARTTHAAVLCADMRGYTALAERLPAARVISLLDEYLTILGCVTLGFGGQVFHTAGDGMMAGFGIGDSRRSGARAAVGAAHMILQRFAPVATRWREQFEVVTGVGVGLHLGEVALGLLGPAGKQTLAMVGDTANVAARLCSRARANEVLFSCAVAAAFVADLVTADSHLTDHLSFAEIRPQLQAPTSVRA